MNADSIALTFYLSFAAFLALTTILLVGGTPMLFDGRSFAAGAFLGLGGVFLTGTFGFMAFLSRLLLLNDPDTKPYFYYIARIIKIFLRPARFVLMAILMNKAHLNKDEKGKYIRL